MIEIDNFTDVPRTSKYQKPVSWARYAEIAKGITKTTFDPKSVYTKTQIIKFIYQVEHTALWTMDYGLGEYAKYGSGRYKTSRHNEKKRALRILKRIEERKEI